MLGAFVTVFVLGIGLFFVIVGLLMWLWNLTMPELFGLKSITFWQSFRLVLISGILFGSGNFFSFTLGA